MIELPAAVSGASFDDRGEMVRFMAPHRSNDRNVVDDTSHMWKPIRDRNTTLAITRELALAGNDRPAHFGQVVSEAYHVDQLAGPFVIFGIESVDMANAATHEQENDRFRLGRKVRSEQRVGNLAGFGPDTTQRGSEEPAAGLVQKSPPRDAAAGIEVANTHDALPHIDEFIQIEQ